MKPKKAKGVYLSGDPENYYRYWQRGPVIMLDELTRAIAAHGGNQTDFARKVLGHKDGRQVRRYLKGATMAYDAATRLRKYLDEGAAPLSTTPARKGDRRTK